MDELTALSILANTIDTSFNTDLPAAEVFAALNFLAARLPVKWPFVEFRQGLESADENRSSSDLEVCVGCDQVTPHSSATIIPSHAE